MYSRTGLWAVKTRVEAKKAAEAKKEAVAKQVAEAKKSGKPIQRTRAPKPVAAKKEEKPVGKEKTFGKGKRTVLPKEPRFYPTEDVQSRQGKKKRTINPPRVRSSLKPGTVLIILAGRFMGKRVILLKVLPSGLLLVTGPYKLNGVPLRRVNPAYVIATSTSVDISSVKIDPKIDDKYFKKPKEEKKKTEAEFFVEEGKKKKEIDATRVADQKAVDSELLAIVKKTPLLPEYLSAIFSLAKGQAPHKLKF
jgi:large subunit ribosomal protein L6e